MSHIEIKCVVTQSGCPLGFKKFPNWSSICHLIDLPSDRRTKPCIIHFRLEILAFFLAFLFFLSVCACVSLCVNGSLYLVLDSLVKKIPVGIYNNS